MKYRDSSIDRALWSSGISAARVLLMLGSEPEYEVGTQALQDRSKAIECFASVPSHAGHSLLV